jgi:NAD(P)-dependent dehydrogenase (short-subunit alcohol dehydrogenase family)
MTVLQMLKPHAGLRVLVTGGASGIGLVIARAFIDAGSRVHVCDVSQQAIDALNQAEQSTEVNAITTSLADVSDRAAVDRVFDDVNAQLGGLDVLINNAGIAGPTRVRQVTGNRPSR